MFKPILAAGLALASATATAGNRDSSADAALIEHGRYVTKIAGCNDCHTAGFAPSGGKVPEAQWLTGDRVGFAGPWGTTYPSNLRLKIGAMDLATWKTFARSLTTRPPMPYWAVNAMSDRDLEALWAYVHSLGLAGELAPPALPPGVEPAGPVVRFPAPPASIAQH
jgi:mono/diheme cytochrome c family protein